MTRPRLEKPWDAIVAAAQTLISAKNVQRLFINYKAGNKQVQLAIVVIVEPNGARGPARCRDAGFISHISERAVTVIVIKNIAAITRDIKVDPTIAIVIARRDAHA